jgi:hypothetical protein
MICYVLLLFIAFLNCTCSCEKKTLITLENGKRDPDRAIIRIPVFGPSGATRTHGRTAARSAASGRRADKLKRAQSARQETVRHGIPTKNRQISKEN